MARPPKLPPGISMFRGRYRVRITVDGRQYGAGMYTTASDARAALARYQADAARGVFEPPSVRTKRLKAEREAAKAAEAAENLTLRQWIETWLASMEADPNRSGATVRSYRSVLAVHVLPVLGDLPLVDIEPADVAALLADVAALPSKRNPEASFNGTAPRLGAVLRSCFNAAVRAEKIAAFPFPDVLPARRVVPADPDGDVATPAEVAAFAAEMPARLALAVTLAAHACLRFGEVLGLQRNDFIDLDGPLPRLRIERQFNVKAGALTPPKGSRPGKPKVRTVALPPSIVPQVRRHLSEYVDDSPTAPVFTAGNQRSRRVSQSTLDRTFREARTKCGRTAFTFHQLRHSGLTWFGRTGASLREIMERGGHTNPDVALRYQHSTIERDAELARRMDAMSLGDGIEA